MAQLLVHEGDHVQAGQLLLQLWNEDLAAERTLAEREATAAEARADEACVQADVARREADRVVSLRGRKLVSEEQVDRAVADADARQAGCRAGRAAAEVNHARVRVTQAVLDRTILLAPFDGVVAEVNAELGEFVTPSPPGIPTPPAVDLIDDHCPYVEAPIDEVDAAALRTGLPARIALDAFPGKRFDGIVTRIAPYVLDVEKQARTVAADVAFTRPEETKTLLVGYSADVEIVLAARDDVLRVPTEALLEGDRVLVYDANREELEERRIDKGISNWEFTEVRSGLQQGDLVVVSVAREGVKAGATAEIEQPSED